MQPPIVAPSMGSAWHNRRKTQPDDMRPREFTPRDLMDTSGWDRGTASWMHRHWPGRVSKFSGSSPHSHRGHPLTWPTSPAYVPGVPHLVARVDKRRTATNVAPLVLTHCVGASAPSLVAARPRLFQAPTSPSFAADDAVFAAVVPPRSGGLLTRVIQWALVLSRTVLGVVACGSRSIRWAGSILEPEGFSVGGNRTKEKGGSRQQPRG